MSEHIYKVIELVGSSKTTIEDAVKNALSQVSEPLRNSRWFEVTQIRGEIENKVIAYWQIGLKIGFTLEESKQKEKAFPETEKKETAKKDNVLKKYHCKVCGYVYDPEKGDPDNGIKPGTPFSDLPSDWVCPECGVNKDQFEEMGE